MEPARGCDERVPGQRRFAMYVRRDYLDYSGYYKDYRTIRDILYRHPDTMGYAGLLGAYGYLVQGLCLPGEVVIELYILSCVARPSRCLNQDVRVIFMRSCSGRNFNTSTSSPGGFAMSLYNVSL